VFEILLDGRKGYKPALLAQQEISKLVKGTILKSFVTKCMLLTF